mgnify:CR=1 FL=1
MSQLKKVQAMFAQDIVDACNNGICPWQSPVFGKVVAEARSVPEGRRYSGMNSMLLALRMIENGWKRPFFGTFKAWTGKMNTKVKKGAKSCSVTFFSHFPKKDKDGNIMRDEDGEPITYPMLKWYSVCNVEDTEADLSKFDVEERGDIPDAMTMAAVIKATSPYITKYRLQLSYDKDAECGRYELTTDRVVMPPPSRYTSFAAFCEGLLHELAHSTMTEGRLNRPQSDKPSKRAEEELTAEIASSIIMTQLGIPHTKYNDGSEAWKSYCVGWAQKINEDPSIIWKAAGNGIKAAEFILGYKFADAEQATTEEKVEEN